MNPEPPSVLGLRPARGRPLPNRARSALREGLRAPVFPAVERARGRAEDECANFTTAAPLACHHRGREAGPGGADPGESGCRTGSTSDGQRASDAGWFHEAWMRPRARPWAAWSTDGSEHEGALASGFSKEHAT